MITAIYDGHCVICNTTRRLVRAFDWLRRVEFLDLHQQDEVARRYPTIDHEAAMGAIHVVDRSGRVFAGFDGTRRMLRELPLLLPLWLLLNVPGIGNWLGPRLYGFIARNRYAINRLLGVEIEQQRQEEADCDTVCKMPDAR